MTKQLSQWDIENNATHAKTLAFTAALASALGDNFKAMPQPAEHNGEYGKIQMPGGLILDVRCDMRDGRAIIDGDYSDKTPANNQGLLRFKNSDDVSPRISVRMDRTPESIAHSVRSKLIRLVEEFHATLSQRKAEFETRTDKVLAGARELEEAGAGVFKLTEGEPGNEHSLSAFPLNGDKGYAHQIRVHGNTTTWELRSLPIPVAKRLIAFLAQEWTSYKR